MKKIILIVTVALMAFAASAKKWENYVNAGVRLPLNSIKLDSKDMDSTKKIGPIVGGDIGYTGVMDNGFSVRAILDVNFAKTDIEIFDDKADGINIEAVLGAGYAPIHTDNMLLGVYGILGVNRTSLNYSREVLVAGGSKTEYKYTFTYPVMGAHGMFVYTFSKCFSVYSSLSLELLFAGEGKVKINSDSKSNDMKTTFLAVPALGCSWKF